MPATPSTVQFHSVRVTRASDDVLRQIKASIQEGILEPGARLPSEKELAEQFGLSRITIRDALRVLESQGLVEIKVGAGGGAFVTQPNAQRLMASLTDLLRLQKASMNELVEARVVIETAIAAFAAERATASDFEAMQRAIEDARAEYSSGNPRFTDHSVDFHIAFASAAKNPVLLFTVSSFRTLFYETLDKLLPDDAMALRAIKDHQLLLDAIKARDAERARHLVKRHLTYFRRRVQKLTPKSETLKPKIS
jgi:GntR family transcriptional regulator, transcriptional repressor for pyruvate dehydrogenase complex